MNLGGRDSGASWCLLLAGFVATAAMVVTWAVAAPAGQPGDATGGLVDPNAVPIQNPPPPPPSVPGRARPAQPGRPELPSLMPPTSQPAASQPTFTGPPPEVKVEQPNLDFGKLIGTDTVTQVMKLKNVGQGSLTIESVQPTCGCTVVNNWAKTVPPGGSWECPATVKLTGYSGKVSKYINVRTNDPKQREIRYTISGEVQPRFAFQPARQFQLGRCQRDVVCKSKIKIINQLDEPVHLKKATVDNTKLFAVELKELKAGREYEVELATVPPLNEGFAQVRVTIETDSKQEPKIEVLGYAQVPPRLTLAPTMVAVPSPLPEDAKRSMILRNEGTTPVHVTGVEPADARVRSEVTTIEDGKQYQIQLTVPKGLEIPITGMAVTVLTDDKEIPKFPATIRAYPSRPVAATRPFATTRPAVLPTPPVHAFPTSQRAAAGAPAQ